jgi:SAM-dependent methyltransferase
VEQEYQRTYWEAQGSRRSPRHPVVEAFSRPKLEFIRRHMPDLDVATVVDIGAGNGYFTWLLDCWGTTVAIDYAQAMLRQHPARHRLRSDALALPLQDDAVDVAFCGNLLHHLSDPAQAVAEMKRVARRYVVLVEPNRNNPLMFAFGMVRKAERGTLTMHQRRLVQLLEQQDLHVVAATTMGTIVPNLTPTPVLPLLRLVDGHSPLGFYSIAIGQPSP